MSVVEEKKSIIPLCVDCQYLKFHGGIGGFYACATPQRKGDFSPVTGWQHKEIDPYVARADNSDCGVAGNFFKAKPLSGVVTYAGHSGTNRQVPEKNWFIRLLERLGD
jgi:hypothetical protein